MFAMPQLRPIFLSLFFVSLISFSMEKPIPEASWESYSSDEDVLFQQYDEPKNNGYNNSKNEQKTYKKNYLNNNDISPKSKSVKIRNISSNIHKESKNTKKNKPYSPNLESENNPIDFGCLYQNLKNTTSDTDQYKPVGAKSGYSNPNEINSNYKQFIESAPNRIKLILRGLKYPEKVKKMDCLKRLLLYGEPGNGKTSLAKAIGLEIYGKYYYISTPNLLDSYKNCHTNLLTEINPLIEKGEPGVIIFDEINCITDQSKNHNSSDETMPTALSLLLDYCAENAPFLFIIGTTNNDQNDFPEKLNSRFGSNKVCIPYPNDILRKQIINEQLIEEKNNLTEDNITDLVKQLEGKSCRDIINIVHESILYSFGEDNIVTMDLINLAIEQFPCTFSKYKILAQILNKTEDEIRKLQKEFYLLQNNRELVDFIHKQEQLELQKESINQAKQFHNENKAQTAQYRQEDLDRHNQEAGEQAFLNLTMNSINRSAQVNFGVCIGGASAGIGGTQQIVKKEDYEIVKNALSEEKKKGFEDAQAKFDAAQSAQLEQNQQSEEAKINQVNQLAAYASIATVFGMAVGGPIGTFIGLGLHSIAYFKAAPLIEELKDSPAYKKMIKEEEEEMKKTDYNALFL
jgi:hypothetical protein